MLVTSAPGDPHRLYVVEHLLGQPVDGVEQPPQRSAGGARERWPGTAGPAGRCGRDRVRRRRLLVGVVVNLLGQRA